MTFKTSISVLITAMALGACASTDTSSEAPAGNSASAAASAGVARAREGLPPQTMEPGECGLFLWTRREQPQFVFFALSGQDTAQYWLEGETIALSRTALGGDIFGQQLTEQDFADSAGRAYQLRMTPGDVLVGGQRIPEATLTMIDPEGWKTLVPLAGVSACQPET